MAKLNNVLSITRYNMEYAFEGQRVMILILKKMRWKRGYKIVLKWECVLHFSGCDDERINDLGIEAIGIEWPF